MRSSQLSRFDRNMMIFSSVVMLIGLTAFGQFVGPYFSLVFFYLMLVMLVSHDIGGWYAYAYAVAAAVSRSLQTVAIDMSMNLEVWSFLNVLFALLFITHLITSKNRLMDTLEQLSLTDPLTKLPNRRAFNQRIVSAVAHSRRYGEQFSLAFIDVDGFKGVNDRQGHQRGDELLQLIAERIKHEVRADDTGARLGGDEFGLIFMHQPVNAEGMIRRLKSDLDVNVKAHGYPVSFSIGVVNYNGVAPVSCDALVRCADTLMYEVKHTSKNGIKWRDYATECLHEDETLTVRAQD